MDQFRKCLVEKMLIYALGRGLERSDRPTVEKICRNLAANGDRFPTLILEIAKSEAFRQRKMGKGDS
jgi:hypothetical protein